jgi:hypothetical protein
MTTLPSRAQIDRAEPLDFPDRKPAKQELTITIHARIDGYDCEICFTGGCTDHRARRGRSSATQGG